MGKKEMEKQICSVCLAASVHPMAVIGSENFGAVCVCDLCLNKKIHNFVQLESAVRSLVKKLADTSLPAWRRVQKALDALEE